MTPGPDMDTATETDARFCQAVSQHGKPVTLYGLGPLPPPGRRRARP